MSETQARLTRVVRMVATQGWGFFCHNEKWCEVADQSENPCDCQDCIIDYYGEDYDPDVDEGVVCQCGACEQHEGSLVDVKYIIHKRGGFIGAVVCVGTGGPRIELDTRSKQVIGYWGGCDPVYEFYPDSESVAAFWEEHYQTLVGE